MNIQWRRDPMSHFRKPNTSLHNIITVSLAGIILSISSIAAFLLLGLSIKSTTMLSVIDRQALQAIVSIRNPVLTAFFKTITIAADSEFFLLLMPLLIIIFVRNRLFYHITFLLLSLLGSSLLNHLFKILFLRIRPTDFFIMHETGYSYPSAHAMVSLCFYGMLAYMANQLSNRKAAFMIITASVLLVALIGFSRLYLGLHWPSDILGGYTAGSVWLIICISLFKQFKK
jgi:undecaprenyl-diphosphatase